jgi:hypothetical protein
VVKAKDGGEGSEGATSETTTSGRDFTRKRVKASVESIDVCATGELLAHMQELPNWSATLQDEDKNLPYRALFADDLGMRLAHGGLHIHGHGLQT